MVKSKRRLGATVLALVGVLLAACVPRPEALDVTQENMIGRWQIADERMETALTFDASGEVTATSWSRNFQCAVPEGDSLDALAASTDKLNLSGRWSVIEVGSGTEVLMIFTSPECEISIVPQVVTMPDRSVVLEIVLAPLVDPDLRRPDQTARFVKAL
ncbi:hypothetical protein AB0N73_12430 [Microbacterium sp. NPDC089189]|uniref:hypothetical protein n=1 Tax=Microbacterium sp. NPDC089189 TaxID=3154972 RepID=UPI0034198A8C